MYVKEFEDMKSMIKGVAHLGILANDPKKSAQFYVDNFGFSFDGSWICMDSEAGALEIAFVTLGDCVIELFRPAGAKGDFLKEKTGIIHSFAKNKKESGFRSWSCLAKKVHSLSKSLSFYESLGFDVKMQEGNGNIGFVELNGFVIELIQTDENTSLPNNKQKGEILDHIALDVKNIEHLYRKMKKSGFSMKNLIVKELALGNKGIRYFMIQGPDGELLEMNERN